MFLFPRGMNEKKRRAHFRMAGYARHTMCTSVFSFIPQGNEKNQQSVLKTTKIPPIMLILGLFSLLLYISS